MHKYYYMKKSDYDKNDIDIIIEAFDGCCGVPGCKHQMDAFRKNPLPPEEDAENINNMDSIVDNIFGDLIESIKSVSKTNKFNREQTIELADKVLERIQIELPNVDEMSFMDDEFDNDGQWNDEDAENKEDLYKIDAEFRPGKKYGESSVLEDVIEKIYACKDFACASETFKTAINGSRINPNSKSKILFTIDTIAREGGDLNRLLKYATNCMFKMKKMGLK